MTEDEVLALFTKLSNASKWGSDDELGTLNLITPTKRAAAARLVRLGRVISLSHDLLERPDDPLPRPFVHRMLLSGSPGEVNADLTEVMPHGDTITHLDALSHMSFEGGLYNGRMVRDEASRRGLRHGSLFAYGEGIVTRGVLLDVARAREVSWLEPEATIGVADLTRALAITGVELDAGDAVLVRGGVRAQGRMRSRSTTSTEIGMDPECLVWMHEHQVAVFGGDCEDKQPSPYPRVHFPFSQVAMVAMGLCLLDTAALEELAQVCNALGVYEFMLVVAPLRIVGGTGCAVNPLALF